MSDPTHALPTVIERAPERMHPLVQVALANDQLDPATIRDLLATQREWEASEARRAYVAAMSRCKADLPAVIPKTAQGHVGRYAPLHVTVETVTPHLAAHGFSASWQIRQPDAKTVIVSCRIQHTLGHAEEVNITLPLDTSGSKSGPQQVGATITYGRRYTLESALGIATAEMDADEDQKPASQPGIDTERNLRALSAILKRGKTREEAEAHVGRPVREWTGADLDALREWLRGATVDAQTDAVEGR
jgi:hypothetical protein